MNQTYDVVIVGGGHSGAAAAIGLRKHGYAGSIAILSAEDVLPYERPPLSKEYLGGEKPFERIMIRPPAFWEERKIIIHGGSAVAHIDPTARSAVCTNGDEYEFGKLIWAAGGTPRKLNCPGAELDGIFSIRDLTDADALAAKLSGGAKRAVIVGGGYIGLEAAAVLRKFGCEVTLLEMQDRVLARVAGDALSGFVAHYHERNGVRILTGAMLEAFTGEGGKLSGVLLADGNELDAEIAIVGIGIVPNVAALSDAGAATSNGVEVDEFCQTSLENIYAIGDCAAHHNHFAGGERIRIESVQNANDMGDTVSRHICGEEVSYAATPWFWSNQYDLRLQSVGMNIGHDREIVRGDSAQPGFSVVYLREGRVIALDCINATRDYVQGRKLVEQGAQPDLKELADPEVPLKSLLK